MSIKKINEALPVSTKITDINDMLLEAAGLAEQGKFNKYSIDALYSGTGLSSKYVRSLSLGKARTGASAWWNWEHVTDGGGGYSIWKFPLYNYEHNTINLMKMDNKKLTYRGEATSEVSTTFDSVFLYDGVAYTDKTTDAGTKTENNFSVLADTSSYLYIGDDAVFTGCAFEFQTFGQNYTLVFAYWNGSEWKTLNANDHEITDNTSAFISDGLVTFTNVGNWSTTAVNGTTRYWIRISTTTTPVVTASAYSILPGRGVPELLALSSSELQDEEFKWCYFEDGVPATGSVYTTLRNTGATSYEGDYYITSSSSDANKENYFYAKHFWDIDHEDTQYDESSQPLFTYNYQDHDGRIKEGAVVSISGCGLRPASALSSHTRGFGISQTTPASGANCRVLHFGVASNVLSEKSGSGILCGDDCYIGTGAGQITRTAPVGSGQIVQIIGTAKADEVSATDEEGKVDIALFIERSYIEV